MPKVETSYKAIRGENTDPTPFTHYVSNIIGIKNYNSRVKRELNQSNQTTHTKRKLVKKLIRVEPIFNHTSKLGKDLNYYNPNDYLKLDISLNKEMNDTVNITRLRNHRRKMLVIKKKKLYIKNDNGTTEGTHKRKVIVTKKRLLPKTISSENTVLSVSSVLQINPTKRRKVIKVIKTSRLHKSLNIFNNDNLTDSNDKLDNLEGIVINNTQTNVEENIDIETTEKTENSVAEESTEFTVNENITDKEYVLYNHTISDLDDENDDGGDYDSDHTEYHKSLPDYEPFFPELSESLDDQILLLKTTVLSTVTYETMTITESKLRTYTFVVTRVNGDEQFVTSTTEVKPHTKIVTNIVPSTRYTTLTLLDLDATRTLPFIPNTLFPSTESSTIEHTQLHERSDKAMDEARFNLATRIMKNGVEVIVAGDKTTFPGISDLKRVLPSTAYKPVTLKPSTLTNNMMMILPHEASNIESLSSSLYPNEFVTKTCLTTFTYLTTYLENGTTTVSSHEQVVSNVATEERNTGKILPTPTMGITLTQYPNLAVGTFVTTYTYLNTILDGEQPLVVTSRRIVTNTVTAPDDYLSLLAPNIKGSVVKDTNTYYSTINLEKTLYEGSESQVIKTNEIVTQVVITESVPPKALSVMTSYIALDMDDPNIGESTDYTTTDIVKTYFVTYTYHNTVVENGNTIVKMNVSTSSDVVTEKLFVHPRTKVKEHDDATTAVENKKKNKSDVNNFQILATKTYLTTYTHFTTLLQEENDETSTVVSSHSRIVENIVTETIEPSLLDKKALTSLKREFRNGINTIVKVATINGQKIEITAISKEKTIKPTKVLPIDKTKMPESSSDMLTNQIIESSDPNIITGSTILFDNIDDPFAIATDYQPTPSLKSSKLPKTSVIKTESGLVNSQITKKSDVITSSKRKSNIKRNSNKSSSISTTKQSVNISPSVNTNDPDSKKKTSNKISKPKVPDLLGLGSINIKALTPVINAMAGLIQTNLKASRRNDSILTTTEKRINDGHLDHNIYSKSNNQIDIANRSPIYIPVGISDIETAESQNIGSAIINQYNYESEQSKNNDQVVLGKTSHASPLINGGIPISPGEVITANSDVIVGKIGVIGPRIPSIPLTNPDEIGMKPPPPPNIPWSNRQNDQFSSSSTRIEKPLIHAPNKDDYIGPPPPKHPSRPQNLVRGEKHKHGEYKHIPLNNNNKGMPTQFHPMPSNINNDNIFLLESNNNQVVKSEPRPVRHEDNSNNFELRPHNIIKFNQPENVQADIISNPVDIFQIQHSILNDPIDSLPEVIERSTGQPLLVNIQPSQVAFVNIPHNRTTALIYGGSTEPHKNGQYFDDPSPYPQPEFSGIEGYRNGVPKFASVYNEDINRKEVEYNNNVGPAQSININPFPIPIDISQVSNINPSKPINYNQINGVHVDSHVNNHDINVNVPPISFGMIHQGNDFNAHIIKHQLQNTHGQTLKKYPSQNSGINQNNNNNNNRNKYRLANDIPKRNPTTDYVRPFQRYPSRPNYTPRPVVRPRPKPDNNIADFMVPPPVSSPNFVNDHSNRLSNPIKIPYESDKLNVQLHEYSQPSIPSMDHIYDDSNDNNEDDLINEAGEVIQESNSRPLTPGQIPIEILKAYTTTMQPYTVNMSTFTNYHVRDDMYNNRHRPVVKEPKPFEDNIRGNVSNHFNNNKNKNNNLNVYNHVPQYNVDVNLVGTIETSTVQFPTTINHNYRYGLKDVTTDKHVYHVQNMNNNYNENFSTNNNPLKNLLKLDEQNFKMTSTDNPNRPKVTSLPINTQVLTTNRPFRFPDSKISLQTEEPFRINKFDVTTQKTVFSFGSRDTVATKMESSSTTTSPYVKHYPTTSTPNMELNIGEIHSINYNLNRNETRHNLQILRPPPEGPIEGLKAPIQPPDIKMQPPKIHVTYPSNVYNVPQIINSTMNEKQHYEKTTLPHNQEVLGMVPPSANSIRPIMKLKQEISTNRPIFSLELDSPSNVATEKKYPTRTTIPYIFELPATKPTTKPVRSRRPITRRPTVYRTTTTYSPTTTRKQSYWQRPVTPLDFALQRNRTRRPITKATTPSIPDVTTELTLTSPIIQNNVNMQVIIGHPDQIDNDSAPSKPELDYIELAGSEIITNLDKVTKNTMILQETTPLPDISPTVDIQSTDSIKHDLKTGLHHSGNEIKIIDETVNNKIREKTFSKEAIAILPTRYITHTKTSTVTITKTTVVKSLGAPPSTLTILVTKTEMITIVDTVTEFHTLLKPTNIVEVITTTVNQPSSLYPSNIAYGSNYSPNHFTPTTVKGQIIEPTVIEASVHDDDDEDTDTFVIHDLNDDLLEEKPTSIHSDNESFFVVMTDKNKTNIIKIPHDSDSNVPESYETQNRDEMINNNEVNRVLLGGILIASPPSLETPNILPASKDKCSPECKASRNELCQRLEGIMRCVCRPGFARMFPDRPCKPTYTYTIKLVLERNGKDRLSYEDTLADTLSPQFIKLASTTHNGLDRMVMQSDLRDIYHGVNVLGYQPIQEDEGIINTFNLQLSDNTDETRLNDVFKKYLRNNNYSLGGTELYASKEALDRFEASDFNECSDIQYHDCSEFAQCFNLRGTYTCSCKEGYADLSENIMYPGRVCSAELVGCEKCHYHGTCYAIGDEQTLCECFQWYAGENCYINLKVLLIALVTLGTILFTLLLICIIITCARQKSGQQHRRGPNGSGGGLGFLPPRGVGGANSNHRRDGTIDRRAIIMNDTSSESGQSDTNTLPYVQKKQTMASGSSGKGRKFKGALKKSSGNTTDIEHGGATISFPDQKDRSLTVMIPRAKYHPAPTAVVVQGGSGSGNNSHNHSTSAGPSNLAAGISNFEKRKNSAASSNEAKLLSYLDAGPSPNKLDQRKYSKASEPSGSRKTSGALVSAGFEVSATVGCPNMGTVGTNVMCGTEADRSENATLIQKISHDLLSSAGTQSQFNTIRNASMDADDEDTMSNWLDINHRVKSVSESRSYDETTIQPPMKTFRHNYNDSKHSSHQHDEANTMAERDLGSTFLLPHTHLYKADRGSDISGFESL